MAYTVGSTEVSEGFRPLLGGEDTSASLSAPGHSPRGTAHAINEAGEPLCLVSTPLHLFPDEGFPVEADGVYNCSACLAAA